MDRGSGHVLCDACYPYMGISTFAVSCRYTTPNTFYIHTAAAYISVCLHTPTYKRSMYFYLHIGAAYRGCRKCADKGYQSIPTHATLLRGSMTCSSQPGLSPPSASPYHHMSLPTADQRQRHDISHCLASAAITTQLPSDRN